MASTTTTSVPVSTPTSSNSAPAATSTISPGAKVGLTVSVSLLGLSILAMAGFFLVRWYRRRKHLKGALHGPMLPFGPVNVDAEKQYPTGSQPTAGGMGATISHRGDFDWQNVSEEGYDDPLMIKGPRRLDVDLGGIGPVGFYGQGPHGAEGEEHGDVGEGGERPGYGSEDRIESFGSEGSRSTPEEWRRPARTFSWGDGSTVANVRSRTRDDFTDDAEVGTPLPLYSGAASIDPDRKVVPPHANEPFDPTTAAELPVNDPRPRRRMTREYELDGQGPGRPRRTGNVDEQKFLLSDVQMARMREEKQQRAAILEQQRRELMQGQEQEQEQEQERQARQGETRQEKLERLAPPDRFRDYGHVHSFGDGTSSADLTSVASREDIRRPLNLSG